MKITERYSFLDALMGLVLSPGETTEALLREETPPYAAGAIAMFVITTMIPVLYHLSRYGATDYAARVVFSLTSIVIISLILFFVLESLFLFLLGIDFELHDVFCIIAYCLSPTMFSLWLVYTANFLLDRDLTLALYLLTGHGEVNNHLLTVIPILIGLALLSTVFIFYNSIQNLGETHWMTSLVITGLSVFPLILSVALSIHIANQFVPETASTVFAVFRSFMALLRISY